MNIADPVKLRAEVETVLVDSGYSRLSRKFAVGSIEFDVEGVFSGPPGTLSLVLVHDGPTSREQSGHLYWLVQRLVRALDAEGSRISVTVILVGGDPDDRLIGELQGISRVLPIDENLPVSRLLAPITKMTDGGVAHSFSNGLEVLDRFVARQADTAGMKSLVRAAPRGSEAVEDALRKWIDLAIGGSK